mgnify:CR=1 FL=1
MSEEAEPMVSYDSGVELHTSHYSRLHQHAAPEDLDLEEFEAILMPNHPLTRRVWWWAKVFRCGSHRCPGHMALSLLVRQGKSHVLILA